MKRYGNLWPELVSFGNLLRAAQKASRGKHGLGNVARFNFYLEPELFRLQEELESRRYTPGPYRTFTIYQPKVRQISAAAFRDRVVHHALCNVVEPIFERGFSSASHANRRGKGTHAAVDQYTRAARRFRYVLKCDVEKYFPSIDHAVLKELLRRKLKDPDVLWLIDRILDHSNPQEPRPCYFPGDDLFTPAERRRGLPLGNQTSQFFANVYLDPFDHWVEEVLRPGRYLRYVDDFVLFSDDRPWLARAREACRDFLAVLRLRLHPTKVAIAPTAAGMRFLGYRVFPDHRLLPRSNVVRMRRRLKGLAARYARQELTLAEMQSRVAGWLGHALHADTFLLRQRLLSEVEFSRKA